ncbi:MAG: glycosyltransferase family 39 protein [Candidatus Thorarchaeota archaeon]|nr:glycosyltransferase family 39 protein [Candidatus Thorarchaeota archaeon]
MTEHNTGLENEEGKSVESLVHTFIRQHQTDVILLLSALIATLVSCIYYLSTMLAISAPGLTLDDSWIHVQFARTIFEGTPWEYSPGYPSTGSTSPLWSIILVSVFFFTTDPIGIVWGTYVVSIIFYFGSTCLAGRIVTTYLESAQWGIVAIIAFVVVPRNTWLMLSGMETPLFVFILLLSIVILDKQEMKYDLVLGVLAGLAFLSRPEGIIVALCIPIRFAMLTAKREVSLKRFGTLVLSGLIALAVAAPWILHCLNVTGYPLPDTFYAKVHEPTAFEIETWDIFWSYFIRELFFLPVGAFLGIILIAKGKPFAWLLPVSLTVLYRLSTPYAALINNNRYLLPVFDLFLIAAIASAAIFFRLVFIAIIQIRDDVTLNTIGVLMIAFLIIVPLIPSYSNQAIFYGKAAGNINDMQVEIGKWLADNTPPDAVFATHDAGALRFFSNRTMIDLAGLVSPDIIHGNMTDYYRMKYLYEHGCNYIVFFPELFVYYYRFFPGSAIQILYTVELEDNVICGRDSMRVYHIDWERTTFYTTP